MDQLRVAVATDDGRTFVGRHFGDAEFYDVYSLTPEGSEFLERVTNESGPESTHADPVKAKGIAGLLLGRQVQVALTRAFGPNIKRIKRKFVCVLTPHPEVTAGLAQAQENFPALVREYERGEERGFLDLRR